MEENQRKEKEENQDQRVHEEIQEYKGCKDCLVEEEARALEDHVGFKVCDSFIYEIQMKNVINCI